MVLIVLKSNTKPCAVYKLAKRIRWSNGSDRSVIGTGFGFDSSYEDQNKNNCGNNGFASEPRLFESELSESDQGLGEKSKNTSALNFTELSSYCFPIYHKPYSNKDFAYRFIYSKICVQSYEKTIDLPLRPNFVTFPDNLNITKSMDSPQKFVEGPIFINMSSPIVIPGGPSGPVAEWFFTMNINRSYYEEEFHAQISLSCRPKEIHACDCNSFSSQYPLENNCLKIPQLFVGIELQMLSSSGEVQLTRRCDEGLRIVSEGTVARYYVPYFLDLPTLQDPSRELIQSLQSHCRVLLTCIIGYENNLKNNNPQQQPPISMVQGTNAPQILTEIERSAIARGENVSGITITANHNIAVKVPLSYVHFIHEQCPSFFSETRNAVLHLETFTAKVIINIMRHITTGSDTSSSPNITWNLAELQQAIELTQRYVPHLKQYYTDMLGDNLCPETAAQALVLSFIYEAASATSQKIMEYFLRNIEIIRRSQNTRFYIENCPLAFASVIFGHVPTVEEVDTDFQVQSQFTNVPLHSFLQETFKYLG